MNSLLENIRIAFSALFSNAVRAILTTIGIGIGIAAVIILITAGNAASDYINQQFLGQGADLITITSNSGSAGGPATRASVTEIKLTERDVQFLSDPNNIPNVVDYASVLSVAGPTTFESNAVNTQVTGTTTTYFSLQNRSIASGRLFDENDELTRARVAVLGQTTINNLFPDGQNPIGQTIRIREVSFRVIGILAKAGGGGFGADQDNVIIVPLTTVQSKLQTSRNVSGELPVSTIYLKVSNTDLVTPTSLVVKSALRTAHKLKANEDDDFSVATAQQTLESLNAIVSVLTVFLGVIGGISLLVGGIGVMNIMLVTVSERTKEIGLRKAVGAKYWDILAQFLTESVVLCTVGGAAGMAVAYLAVFLIGLIAPDLNLAISSSSVILSVSVVTFVGVFFGLYPASQAAALSPIKALRTE